MAISIMACQYRKLLLRHNAKLSRRVAVGSNAGLERGGAANDGHEKNPAPAASLFLNPE
jgi:hypothetical protein